MATACRARFFPGEDREGLTLARDEAARLLPDITYEHVHTCEDDNHAVNYPTLTSQQRSSAPRTVSSHT